ncbi:MAG: S24 family peptidase [Bacillota bacterium]
MDTIGKRIRYLRRREGLSTAALEEAIGSSSGSATKWEKDLSMPGGKFILALANLFDVSTDWLLTGKDQPATALFLRGLTDEERYDVERYAGYLVWRRKRRGVALKKRHAELTIKTGYGVAEEREPWDYKDTDVFLPVLGSAPAGVPIFVDEILEGYIPVNQRMVRGAAFLVRAKGDSMVGADIADGDLVLIRRQAQVESGDIALIRIGEDLTIKYCHYHGDALVLKPANPHYSSMTVKDGAVVIGRVVGTIKRADADQGLRHFMGDE